MGFLSSLRAAPRPRRSGAAFPAADISRLTSSWTTDPGAVNRWLRYELVRLRARSRQMARGDAYGAKFIRACVDNIAGAKPFVLQSKAKFKTSRFDLTANDVIETAWYDRSRPGNCEVTGRLSLGALHRLIVRCIARDGEALIRIHRGGEYGAARLQLLDIDRLDEQANDNLRGGGSIKLGIELDRNSKPVAYHLLKQHPGEMGEWNGGAARERERVPAEQIRHLFIQDWPEQVRGFPWMHAAMVRLWNLGGFEEAAVINARIGASKIAVIQGRESDTQAVLAQNATGKDSAGNFLTDIEPGQYWRLPEGTELNSFDPAFPDASVGPFIAACLRGASAAVGMAYHSFANDPGAVNYSTARVALLEERDMWTAMQTWYVEHFCEPDAVDWMRGAILDGVLPQSYWPYRTALRFQPRTWQWIDPEKEVNAKVTALENKLTSRTRLASENGEDIEDIFDELAAEQVLAKEKGIDLTKPGAGSDNRAGFRAKTLGPSRWEARSLTPRLH
jgi:lambda family phage portal protein